MQNAPTTSSAHTRGPWHSYTVNDQRLRYQPHGFCILIGSLGDRGGTICEVDPLPEWEANARLIAAAPDLKDACLIAIQSMEDTLDGNNPGWMDNMRADLDFINKALAKAEGRG